MLTNRWSVLALLFAIRIGFGIQFQAISALSPLFLTDFRVSAADLGMTIGLYVTPGILLAYPGSAIGQRFGEKRVVLLSLALMIAGGLIMATTSTWTMLIVGRLIAGMVGVMINVLMSKMVTDWFAGKEIATAMGIYVNSWPLGIALALVALPFVAGAGGLTRALMCVAAFPALGFVAMATLYRAPPDLSAVVPRQAVRPKGNALWAVLTAGLIWSLFNSSLGMIFGFGPLMLSERGWTVQSAGSMTSVVLWVVTVTLPLGGLLADRSGRSAAVLLGSFAAFALVLVLSTRVDAILPVFILLGLVSGLPAGPIMSLPNRVLVPETRAAGMGLFFTTFYIIQLSTPWLAGEFAKASGSAAVTFDLGAGFLLVCCLALIVFWQFAESVALSRQAKATA